MRGWIGVDFDGTLAQYGTWVSADHCGEPIMPMVERVRRWMALGHEVRIFTARIHPVDACVRPGEAAPERVRGVDVDRYIQACQAITAIRAWSLQHIGQVLPITNVKDYGMIELWDDRAVQVRPNTGEKVGNSTRGLE